MTSGQTASFTAGASGQPTPTVQWQVSTDGGTTFSNIVGATSTTLSFTTSAGQSGNQYRAVFTDTCGGATTTAAMLTVNTTTVPTVVSYSVNFGLESYSLIGASRTTHLPWTIVGITVKFSEPIATATTASLSGVTATGLSGLGTNTLTWTFPGITNATLSTSLAGSGAAAIKDAAGSALSGGSGFSQAFSVLYGDFNGDGAVTSADLVGVNAATKASYNILADINGDGVVNTADVAIVKVQEGATQQ